MFAAIAYDGLEDDFDTELVKFFCQVERVGVLTKGGQQLRTDGDDLGVHIEEFKRTVD